MLRPYRRRRGHALAPALTILPAALLTALPAAAQESALEEIVVTAQFREQNVQDTPIAITAISGDTLEQRSQFSMTEIAAQAPNVTLQSGAAFGGNSLTAYIRGVGQTDFIPSVEPGVGIYVDDVYYASITGSVMELLDLNRIEILRGPQGTLAGKNSVGGAIRLYTKRPGPEANGFVEVGGGNYDAVRARGATNFTVVEDKLWGRISGVSNSRDGYVKILDYGCTHPGSGFPSQVTGGDCVVGTEGGIDYTAARLAFRWAASDSVDVNLGINIVDEDSEPAPNVAIQVGPSTAPLFDPVLGPPFTMWNNSLGLPTSYGGAPTASTDPRAPGCLFIAYGPTTCDPNAPNSLYVNYSTYADTRSGLIIPRERTLESSDVTLNIDWQVSDSLQLQSITAFRELESGWGQDEDGTPIPLGQLYQFVDQDQFSQEFRLNSTTGDFLDWTLGAFYHTSDTPVTGRIGLGYVGFDFIHGPDPVETTTWAVFANGTFYLSDRFELNAGLRYSDDEKNYRFQRRNPDFSTIQPCLGPPGTPGNPPNCLIAGVNNVTDTFEDDRIDYRVALSYKFSDDALAYASVSTGYKGGGINPRPFFDVQAVNVNPEELTTYEVGFKTDFLNNRARLNAAYFFNDYTDVQAQFTACPQFGAFAVPCLATLNAGDAEVSGFELEFDAALTDSFTMDASVAVLDFEWQSLVPGAAVDPNGITPFTPELTWSIGAQYTMQTSGGAETFARLDANFQDDIFTEANNAPGSDIDNYTLLNGSIGISSSDGRWRGRVEVKNITDEEYLGYTQTGSGVGATFASPGLPRTYMFSIRRDFF